ncbi:GTP-binding protein 10 [Trichinella papuae]|uniref:GTP-binding protein 10 n=1 Tax=Trichinella papuae TaxID=268474 RepID=A0A0V1N6X0_9BILA|nr:GTP-binding protein 10 [Trichinella papuae]
MVFLFSRVLSPVKLKGGGTLLRDHLRIYVRGGSGGKGLERYGAIGGDGGDVYLEVNESATLHALAQNNPSKRFIAGKGSDSGKFRIFGEKGQDLAIPVPKGISVTADDGKLLGNLHHHGDRMLVAIGGEGGSSKTFYTGLKGEPHIIRLDLKLIADIGLLGKTLYRFPNAGKSTLLKALSRAKPRIANYPFTTVRPQLGIMEYEDGRQISVADLPGLIEGSYMNVGMGHKFLKHVERTYLLLFVIDIEGFQLNAASPFRSALETYLLLNKEIELYNPQLVDKPSVICLNKMDVKGAAKRSAKFLSDLEHISEVKKRLPEDIIPKHICKPIDIIKISAKLQQNTDTLKTVLRSAIDEIDDRRRERIAMESLEKESQLLESDDYIY